MGEKVGELGENTGDCDLYKIILLYNKTLILKNTFFNVVVCLSCTDVKKKRCFIFERVMSRLGVPCFW